MTALPRLAPADRPIVVACVCILIILALGSVYTMATQGTLSFLRPIYLLQQLQVGAFLGIVAAGMMLVILLGHIDLSVPWTLTASAMMATAVGGPMAIPTGLAVGLLVGLVNGLGVAVLRVPSMIFTLGVNAVLRGLMVLYTGGFAPQTHATPLMETLAVGKLFGFLPAALLVWAALSVVFVFMLTRTTFGRYLYAIGNRETAAYLSGVQTRSILIGSFVLCGFCSGLAGLLLAGYSSKAYQAMGDAYLLPSIAAVVIGGTHILGGRGRYLGTVVGTILITLLSSVLAVMQMPEAGRQVIYGVVIIAMLLAYGRERLSA
ncbi:MAG: ABC transporter permease [Geminicoccaceae bacterium]